MKNCFKCHPNKCICNLTYSQSLIERAKKDKKINDKYFKTWKEYATKVSNCHVPIESEAINKIRKYNDKILREKQQKEKK